MRFRPSLLAILILCAAAAPVLAEEAPKVVVSIKPIHSLVAGVMAGIGEPHLLVGGGDSPHTYAMRPSDAEALSEAAVVFWIGSRFEAFLERPIRNIGSDVRSVELIEAPGMVLHEYAEVHEDHGHGHADDHAHAHGHHDNEHESVDGHIWLDPANAQTIVETVVRTLSEVDPERAEAYQANGEGLAERLSDLDAAISTRLEQHRDVAFFTFHDAFRYFSEHFALAAQGAITISPERQPGAQRLAEIRARISEHERICIFAEPQFPPRLIDVIVEGTAARTGTLDPLGADLEDGPGLYFDLMEANADAFANCFSATM